MQIWVSTFYRKGGNEWGTSDLLFSLIRRIKFGYWLLLFCRRLEQREVLAWSNNQWKGWRQINSCNVRNKRKRMNGTSPDGGLTQDFNDSQGHLF